MAVEQSRSLGEADDRPRLRPLAPVVPVPRRLRGEFLGAPSRKLGRKPNARLGVPPYRFGKTKAGCDKRKLHRFDP